MHIMWLQFTVSLETTQQGTLSKWTMKWFCIKVTTFFQEYIAPLIHCISARVFNKHWNQLNVTFVISQ